MKKNSARRTLIMSALSLLLCCAMLVGGTAAWFTDTATSTGNKIQAGTLDIDLVMDKAGDGTYTSIADANAPLFGADSGLAQNDPTDTLWEPGKTQIAYLGVQNKGNLALKYNIILDVADNGLASALEYAIIPGKKAENLTEATSWDDIKTAAGTDNIGTVAAGRITAAQNGVLDEIVKGTENETQYFALAIHMKEEAGNEYQGKDITIDVTIVAAQYNVEADTFGSDYDKDVEFDEVEEPVVVDKTPYLTFSSQSAFQLEAESAGWTKITGAKIETSTDAKTWTVWDGTAPVASEASDTNNVLYVRGYMPGGTTYYCPNAGTFTTTHFQFLDAEGVTIDKSWNSEKGKYEMTEEKLVYCSGSIMNLLDYEHPDTVEMGNYAFSGLFSGCKALASAPSLPAKKLSKGAYQDLFYNCESLAAAPALPATELADYCYLSMFDSCYNMTSAPKVLPATVLKEECYQQMFCGCINLQNAPEIKATTLAEGCCESMFSDCESLTEGPSILPAEVLEKDCYCDMFSECESLKSTPILPAKTLAKDCYRQMFQNCTSLETVTPVSETEQALSATSLAEGCYQYMFKGCTSLVNIPDILPATTLKSDCYKYMFKGCSSLRKAPKLPATEWVSGCYTDMFDSCSSLKVVTCDATDPDCFLTTPTSVYYGHYMFYDTPNASNSSYFDKYDGDWGNPKAETSYKCDLTD